MNKDGYSATRVVITGRPIGKRFEVVLNGTSLALTGTSFYYLFRLAHQAVSTVDGWIAAQEIEPGNRQARYLYRLKGELIVQGANGSLIVENNKRGSYRLDRSTIEIRIDNEELSRFPDVRVRERVTAPTAQRSVSIEHIAVSTVSAV